MGTAAKIDELQARLEVVERRLSALESGRAPEIIADEDRPELAALGESVLSGTATQVGRVLLIFGGAYLLRAITEFEYVPTGVGISLGAAYALTWLWMADRAGGQPGRRAGAVFYGFATTALGFPLVIEACTRFDLLSGAQGMVALTLFCLLGLVVAGRRYLRSLAWLMTGVGAGTAFVLSRALHVAVPTSVFLLVLGLAALWAGYYTGRRWGPQWIGAIAANAGLLTLTLIGTSDQWALPPLAAPALALALVLGYTASFVLRSHWLQRPVGAFEVLQALFGFAVAAVAVVRALGAGQLPTAPVGWTTLALGIAVYALAFTATTRKQRGADYHFYATYGLVVTVAGSGLLLAPEPAGTAWSVAALVLAIASGRSGRVSLSLQCTLLLITAGVVSGLLGVGIRALAGEAVTSWPQPDAWQIAIALCCVACLFVPVAQHSDRWGVLAGAPQLVVLALSVWEVGGLMIALAAPPLAGVPGEGASLPVLATLRTVVLSAAAVTLALSSRHPRWPEARWLAYPLLILIGIKMVSEDFPLGHPAALFVALAAVGGALIVVSRLLRQDRRPEA